MSGELSGQKRLQNHVHSTVTFTLQKRNDSCIKTASPKNLKQNFSVKIVYIFVSLKTDNFYGHFNSFLFVLNMYYPIKKDTTIEATISRVHSLARNVALSRVRTMVTLWTQTTRHHPWPTIGILCSTMKTTNETRASYTRHCPTLVYNFTLSIWPVRETPNFYLTFLSTPSTPTRINESKCDLTLVHTLKS